MRKFIYVLLFCFLMQPFAFAGTNRPSAHALAWYLEGKNKFEDANVRTRQLPNGTYELYEWDAHGLAKPTDAEIDAIIDDYEGDKDDKKLDKKAKKNSILTKMGLNSSDLEGFIALIEDKNLD